MTSFDQVHDRLSDLAHLSSPVARAFADAGFAQRMRSLYMLLFNLEEIAEKWFGMYGDQMLASHGDRDAVIAELNRPGALTASFGWYRANACPRGLRHSIRSGVCRGGNLRIGTAP